MSIFSDLNEVQILGNVTAKPELKVTQGGVSVTTINVATYSMWKPRCPRTPSRLLKASRGYLVVWITPPRNT